MQLPRATRLFIRIQGVQYYLWRAVDQHGVVLDILVQARRDAQAAKRFLKRLLKGLQYEPRVIVTDKLRSYGVAQRQLLPGVEHRQSRYLNNRAENSHRPTRRRERAGATIQIVSASPGLSLRSLLHLRPLSSPPTSTDCLCLSRSPIRRFQCLAGGNLRPERSMIALHDDPRPLAVRDRLT